MVQEKEVIRLLENMINGADELVDGARRKYDEASKVGSDLYPISNMYYEDLQYFRGYKQGISQVLQNLRKYYFEERVKEAKTASAALYGKSVSEEA